MDLDERFVSTGTLPDGEVVAALVAEAHRRFADLDDGEPSTVYPALAQADRRAFGICVAGIGGAVHAAGDTTTTFPIMSVSKPFTLAVVCDRLGPDVVRDAVGVDATGRSFRSIEAVERSADGRTNPMVNPGAIATASLVPGGGADRWEELLVVLSAFAGRPLDLDEATYASAVATNRHNRALTQLLASLGLLAGDPDDALDLYTRQCCVAVTARDLAVMGATLADGGVNPVTGERVVSAEACRRTLAVMATAGLYETSGRWLYEVGMPAKSGIGGGIVTVAPGKGALGTWSPPLDATGNSVRGQAVAAFLAERLGLDLFASTDVHAPTDVATAGRPSSHDRPNPEEEP